MFRPDERLELLDGALVVSEPQGSRHAATIRRVLAARFGARSGRPGRSTLSFRSRSTQTPNRSLTWLWSSGIQAPIGTNIRRGPDYWIIDLAHDTVEMHRDPVPSPDAPSGWRYRNVVTLSPPATVTPLAVPDALILVADSCPDYPRNCSHVSSQACVVSASDVTSTRSSLPWNRPAIASAVSARENRPKP